MKLRCIKDARNISHCSSVTRGKIYEGKISNCLNNPSYIYFICFDDKGLWSAYKITNFVPVDFKDTSCDIPEILEPEVLDTSAVY